MNRFNYQFDLVISLLNHPRVITKRRKKISSYEAVFKEVDVRVSPVIKGSVNGANHPRETLRDGPRIAAAFRILSEYPVLLTVIPPKPSSCVQQQLRQKKTNTVYSN